MTGTGSQSLNQYIRFGLVFLIALVIAMAANLAMVFGMGMSGKTLLIFAAHVYAGMRAGRWHVERTGTRPGGQEMWIESFWFCLLATAITLALSMLLAFMLNQLVWVIPWIWLASLAVSFAINLVGLRLGFSFGVSLQGRDQGTT